MSTVYNGLNPIVLSIDKNRNIIQGNMPDIKMNIASPSSAGFNIEYNFIFNTAQEYLCAYFKDIVKNITMGKNVSSVSRNISDNQPDHLGWPTISSDAYLFLSGRTTVTTFAITWKNGNGNFNGVKFTKSFPALKTFSAYYNIRSLFANIDNTQNPNFLPSLYSFQGGYSTVLKSLPALKIVYLNMTFNSAINEDFSKGFPVLRQLKGLMNGLDLKCFWNGNPNRMSVNMDNFTGTTWTYSGGASFPSVFSDDPQFQIDYILNQGADSGKLTGVALSRFYVDFANGVDAVTSVYKRFRLIGSSHDPSYPGVEAAITKITKILGITIQTS